MLPLDAFLQMMDEGACRTAGVFAAAAQQPGDGICACLVPNCLVAACGGRCSHRQTWEGPGTTLATGLLFWDLKPELRGSAARSPVFAGLDGEPGEDRTLAVRPKPDDG
jgi:hypothetical protein